MAFDTTWLLTALVTLLTLLLAKEMFKRRNYPPGPFPLPIVGNVLSFFGKRTANQLLDDYRSRYGDVFTVWLGSVPLVFVSGWQAVKEGLVSKRKEFSGRMQLDVFTVMLDGNVDVVFSDPSPKWDLQRRLGHAAVRKYSSTESFRQTVLDVTDTVLDQMLKAEGPIAVLDRFLFITFNILASMAFGKRYKEEDEDYKFLTENVENNPKLLKNIILCEFVPILKPFLRRNLKQVKELGEKYQNNMYGIFIQHKDNYDGTVRDFSDALLYARQEADEEDADLKNLSDKEIFMVVGNLFSAGNDTIRTTLMWAVLYLCVDKKLQEKVVDEILTVIGDSPPSQEDRNRCPLTWSVILEVLRKSPPAPYMLPHKALFDSSIAGKQITAGTNVVFSMVSSHLDQDYWKDPEVFRPERFLEDPDIHKSNYMPFGLGRRACIGEKMAQGATFLVLARLLQRCTLDLDGEPDFTPVNLGTFSYPKAFNVCVKPRKSVKEDSNSKS